jgi:rubrerythrin
MVDNHTIGGQSITTEMLEGFLVEFERDWQESEINVQQTDYGRTLLALQSLDLSVDLIEALVRRAKHENQTLPFYLRSILQNELTR